MKIYDTNKGADCQGSGHYFLRFVHQLAGHVFNFKLKALNARQGAVDVQRPVIEHVNIIAEMGLLLNFYPDSAPLFYASLLLPQF